MSETVFDKKASEIADLILAYLNGNISPAEQERLDKWLSEGDENVDLFNSLRENISTQADSDFFSSIDVQDSLKKIKIRTGQVERGVSRRYPTLLKTACLIILISSGVGLHKYLQKKDAQQAVVAQAQPGHLNTIITPGGNKAKLELANGATIVLENQVGPVIHDKGMRIDRQRGIIYYHFSNESATQTAGYNRVSTPKGGKYEVVLPDGSHVWLNSESSVRFPITPSQKERIIELTGEAYFEVAKMPHRPFKVHVKDVTVEALGTSFNIMSYGNENTIKTTLLEGSIKVSKGAHSKMVIPGQQVEIKEALKIIDDSNIQQAIAWKTDLFEFENDELKTIFPQLERWYNIDIEYTGEISNKRFTGSIPRHTEIKVLLEMLKEAGINYRIEERRIFLF